MTESPPAVHGDETLVVFTLAGMPCALKLAVVERVIRAVEIRPLPRAPRAVMGIINMQGSVMPVIDLQQHLGHPARQVSIDDYYIIGHTGSRRVALAVDEVRGVMHAPADRLTRELPPELSEYQEALKLQGELVLIYDLARLLDEANDRALSVALEENG